ncbi:hypothetical protein GUITHDRAFT_102569 [Guillardia theta CCMP2712]|uniref:Uncharacterized protein n=1 Tax=Guillardia theta (strain CCMP2712) TaxID=905079 RepID=L1JU64_GUITC|nr:hypothetical protein GUITHDRAFT_102569 [Guillardia theta CCMP2712]EKX51957.1 hypothetical protein GUITHDRAFT_102569 [Guillardia theta CCMP2712]|eukprot:XP_005838937.1 hypothetical protein GUITHDRAFT_102569 [Guillardia theta CCMP2712]
MHSNGGSLIPLLHAGIGKSRDTSRSRKLTSAVAIRIFKERSSDANSKFVESEVVARCYGVSSKTVRDIWDKKSWARYTSGLEMRVEAREAEMSKNGEKALRSLEGNMKKDALEIERKQKNMKNSSSIETFHAPSDGYDCNGAMLGESSQDSATWISMRRVYGELMGEEEEDKDKDEHNEGDYVREAVECWDELAEAPDDVSDWCVDPREARVDKVC